MFESAPPFESLMTLLVNKSPSERLRLATLLPFELRSVKELVDPCRKSKVVEPPEKGTLVSAMVMLLNVLAPVKVWTDSRSATVILPVGKVALVTPVVVKVSGSVPATAKSRASVNVPVVQVGCPVPPERSACPAVPTPESSKESASE